MDMKRCEHHNRRRIQLIKLLLIMLSFIVISVSCTREKRPNVILVVIDTLRAGNTSLQAYQHDTTPELKKFAKDAVYFPDALATTPWTVPSFGSILTGTYPHRSHSGARLLRDNGSSEFSGMLANVVTIPRLMKLVGYKTLAVVNNPWLHSRSSAAQGFDVYDYHASSNYDIRRADATTDASLKNIDASDSKFFIMVHYFDPHMTYDPPASHKGRYTAGYKGKLRSPLMFKPDELRYNSVKLSDQDKRFIIGLYDEEVSFTDQQLGRFISGLKQRGLYDDSLIIVTADHGEEHWDHGSFEHGHTLYQELLHVPLLIKYPGNRDAGRKVGGIASIIDIFPTILDYLGLDQLPQFQGISLYDLQDPQELYSRDLFIEENEFGPRLRGMIRGPAKTILNREDNTYMLFDLDTDPLEQEDLASDPGSSQTTVSEQLKMIRALPDLKNVQQMKLDQKERDALRSLGYLK